LGRVCKVQTLKPEPVRLARTAEMDDLMDGSKLQEEQNDGTVSFERVRGEQVCVPGLRRRKWTK